MEGSSYRGVRTRGRSSRGVQKRVFTPTIPQRRVKTEEATEEPKQEVQNGKKQRERRGRGRGRREYIQTEGAPFGEGVAATEKKAPVRDTSYVKDACNNAQMPVYKAPTLKTKKELEEEEMAFADDSDWSSDGESEYFLQLPFGKKRNKVKTEEENNEDSTFDVRKIFRPYIKQEIKSEDEETAEKPAKSVHDPDMLLFLQLPTRLPFENQGIDELTEDVSNTSGPSTEEPKNTKDVDANLTTIPKLTEDGLSLKDMKEGYFGKLQILKSGKMRLVYGPLQASIELDETISFVQEVVAVKKDDEKSPKLVSMGYTRNVLRCSPSVEKYLTIYDVEN